MKKLFKGAVLFLALNIMLVQAVSLTGGVKSHSNNNNTKIEVAGDIDILCPDPICVVRVSA